MSISDIGVTTTGVPYKMNLTDNFGNVHVRDVDRPDIISRLFEESNCVDKHNQVKKFELGLGKK